MTIQFVLNTYYHLGSSSISQISPLISSCFNNPDQFSYSINKLRSSSGLSLLINSQTLSKDKLEENRLISFDLNNCVHQRQHNITIKEYAFHTALAIDPFNHHVAKNLAYIYEWHGHHYLAESLLLQSYRITLNKGTLLQYVFTASSVLTSDTDSYLQFYHILDKANRTLAAIPSLNSTSSSAVSYPFVDITELQLNYEYLGLSPGSLSYLYTHLIQQLFTYPTSVQPSFTPDSQVITFLSSTYPDTIRVGIVAEHVSNTSPGICIMTVIQRLIDLQTHHLLNSNTGKKHIEIIYFGRENDPTISSRILTSLAVKTVILDEFDLVQSAEAIITHNIEILLYLALPTEKFSLLLSMLRLAPIQVQYGIGHPLSSGSRAVDYSVIAQSMAPGYRELTGSNEKPEDMYEGYKEMRSRAIEDGRDVDMKVSVVYI